MDPSLLLDEIAVGDAAGSEGDNDTASEDGLGGLSITQPSLPVSDDLAFFGGARHCRWMAGNCRPEVYENVRKFSQNFRKH